MKKEFFVHELRKKKPTEKQLKNLDVEEEYIHNIIDSFICKNKSKNSSKYSDNILLDLIDNYDCSKVSVGLVRFDYEVTEGILYCKVGNVDVDLLVISRNNGEVQVIDYENLAHIIWKCALNSTMFLESLLVCADFFSLLLNNNGNIDTEVKRKYVRMCADVAGGDWYKLFFGMLFD